MLDDRWRNGDHPGMTFSAKVFRLDLGWFLEVEGLEDWLGMPPKIYRVGLENLSGIHGALDACVAKFIERTKKMEIEIVEEKK